jgi:hypothetical protein
MQWIFFNPDFLLTFLIKKKKLQKFVKIPLGGILGYFGEFWGILGNYLVLGYFQNLIFFIFF